VEQFEKKLHHIALQYSLNSEQTEKLKFFAIYLFDENRKYNLTGHKTLEDILDNLIAGSLLPAPELNVPRGTFFADLGTGAGIPGIPLSIYLQDSEGVLFDSNFKKIRFIEEFCRLQNIKNVLGVSCRIEEAGRDPRYREKFDMVFSRAMADLYIISEMASPLLKTGGYLYLYSRDREMIDNNNVKQHLDELGLVRCRENQNDAEGLLLRKTAPCSEKFPRRISAIKRDRARL
jgi:16S rRNA (guanine527-N7)-methyltransferase